MKERTAKGYIRYMREKEIIEKEGDCKKRERRSVNKRNQGVFDRLIAAGKRLMTVIQHNEGGANKDLAKFADQINALCDKWDR